MEGGLSLKENEGEVRNSIKKERNTLRPHYGWHRCSSSRRAPEGGTLKEDLGRSKVEKKKSLNNGSLFPDIDN